MEVKFKSMVMYKVSILCTGKIALFEGKADAEKYVKMMEEKGHKVNLDKWPWMVQIEE